MHIYSSNLFWGYSKWRQIKYCASGLNRGLTWNLRWLRCVNHLGFIRKCLMCTEKHFSVKNIYKWAKLLKEGRNNIPDEDKPGRPKMVSTPEIVDSDNALNLTIRRVTIENISQQLVFFSGFMMTLAFLKRSGHWFHQDNTKPHTAARSGVGGTIN